MGRLDRSCLCLGKTPSTVPDDLSPDALDAYQFRFESPRIRLRPEFARYALQSFTPGRPMVEALLDLTTRIHKDFRFDSKVTTVRTPIEEVFEESAASARTSPTSKSPAFAQSISPRDM